jgi:hypothetical protein
MRIQLSYKIEKCCAPDDTRPVLAYVNITTFEGRPVAIAADGFMLAVVPVEMEDGDVPGLVYADLFAKARSATKRGLPSASMALGESEVRFADGWTAPRVAHPNYFTSESASKFPDIAPIIRPFAEGPKPETSHSFGLNPRLLNAAWQAIGKPWAPCLHRVGSLAPILITDGYEDAKPVPPFAVVMPMHIAGATTGSRGTWMVG